MNKMARNPKKLRRLIRDGILAPGDCDLERLRPRQVRKLVMIQLAREREKRD